MVMEQSIQAATVLFTFEIGQRIRHVAGKRDFTITDLSPHFVEIQGDGLDTKSIVGRSALQHQVAMGKIRVGA
jgi:hypothetical protein